MHTLGKPDTSFSMIELVALLRHFASENLENKRFSVTEGDFASCFDISGQMNVEARHFPQTLSVNRLKETFGSAVVEDFGRNLRDVADTDIDRMPMISPNFGFIVIERVAVLVISSDDIFESRHIEPETAMGVNFADEFADIRPSAVVIYGKPDLLWFVAKYESDEPTDFRIIRQSNHLCR